MGGGRNGAARAGAEGAIAWLPTLLRGRPRVRSDLVHQPRSRRPEQLWLVIVDASASTRRNHALSQAKGLLAGLFDDAYRQRARLALLTASGTGARWQHQGLKASAGLQPWLDALGAGGGTPLWDAINQAADWSAKRHKRCPAEQQRVLILTDGRVKDIPALSTRPAQPLPLFSGPVLLIDIERGPIRLGRARDIAVQLNADYRHIDEC
ncbi:vWA domain-containing protein [Pseudomonas sp.]|uniref:vWA domain-containing protein n=1 Tax=unclassified Pseudomonas TaxID=196821 RepID=UPI0011F6D02F|nr:VWA domain-containing protein [Pseudomonas sp.]RZI72559.1 MAG: VWA domain-containing protein [Pseudomonas sp.]